VTEELYYEHVVRKGGNERRFGDHVNREMISSRE
jgi:hypothetical protein